MVRFVSGCYQRMKFNISFHLQKASTRGPYTLMGTAIQFFLIFFFLVV